MLRLCFAVSLVSLACAATAAAQVTIDHRWSNTDAQSLIGLPMGSHKTVVDKQGNLKWSQWSLKRRPVASPIGFSAQMDGELAIQAFAGPPANMAPLNIDSQKLYRGRYPFIVTSLHNGDLALEELAFAVDPDARPGVLPNATSGARGMDVVRLTFRNNGATGADALLKLSGRERNLPGHVTGNDLITHGGEDVALVVDTGGAAVSSESNGLELELRIAVPTHGEKTLCIEEPYEWPAARNAELSHAPGTTLLKDAVAQWDDLWARATQINFPQRQLSDFYYSSIAYVFILTEYDKRGDLWTLDGPAVYRQYWGRGEYFQARALEVANFLSPARQSVEHAFHLTNDDGEWDFPPVSGWPAWDNMGGNAGAVWQYYLFSRDKEWLARAYPDLLRTSEWIRDHREESSLEGISGVPVGAEPIHRMIPSSCRPEPNPPLAPGEKPYWFGLLPWSYGDSGIPQGHSFAHNFMAAYAVQVTADAAKVLGRSSDEAWLNREYSNYTAAIRKDVNRALTFEKADLHYLPAMPTYPQAAYSQSFLAVYPTHIYSPEDPLITGLLDRMQQSEKQGLPTNVAWAGPAGVWAGEGMNMAETYLLRGEKQRADDMLVAALNHSYTTKVWKEEILVDPDLPRACEGHHSKRKAQQGTGDMPEAWANANLVLFLRDMLVNERDGKLHLLAGLLPSWVPVGKSLELANAPVTTGGEVSLRVDHSSADEWRITVDPHSATRDFVLHLPMDASTVASVRIDGKPAAIAAAIPFTAPGKITSIEVVQK
ncbi:MAG TPA: hypothetical protein VGS10_05955 [Terracidiphilus sp.]|nr:hypothetical protein [Terracidiphilus sp.]